MSQFIESIQCLNGKIQLLDYHQQRVERTFSHFNLTRKINLESLIKYSELPPNGCFKIRIVYNLEGQYNIEIQPYKRTYHQSFELIEADIDYPFKYENREVFHQLKCQSSAEEIIITQKGYITDTSYSNLIFFKEKENEWFTPKSFLLNGVQRQHQIHQHQIKIVDIHQQDLKNYTHFKLINAMNDLETSYTYPIESIINLLKF